jgi:hypothetical protein
MNFILLRLMQIHAPLPSGSSAAAGRHTASARRRLCGTVGVVEGWFGEDVVGAEVAPEGVGARGPKSASMPRPAPLQRIPPLPIDPSLRSLSPSKRAWQSRT